MPDLQVTFEIDDSNTVELNIAKFAQKLEELDPILGPILADHLENLGTRQPSVSEVLTALDEALLPPPTNGGE